MMNQSRAVAYWTLGRSDLLSMEMAERVSTAVTPEGWYVSFYIEFYFYNRVLLVIMYVNSL